MSQPATPATTDWTTAFDGEFGDAFCQTMRELPLSQLQRFPPPKGGGLPFGHEMRIAQRFLTGGSSMLDPSGLSGVYRRLAPATLQTLYRGMVLGQPLPRDQWQSLIGRESAEQWAAHGLLDPAADHSWRCRFRVIVLGPLRFVVDHNDTSIAQRVHIGQDSLNMMEFVQRQVGGARGSMLDVGTGSGLQLLALGRSRESALGVDINPRAVRLSRLNGRLSDAATCRFEERDAFDREWRPSPFHLITWNLPFMFFPENEVANNLDGHGGHLGIALTLAFVERLADLLHADGVAWLLTSAPVLFDGQNGLEIELARRAERCRLDIATHVLQKYWDKKHAPFHRGHNIRSFESVMVRIRLGSGQFERHPPNAFRRGVDQVRTLLHERGRVKHPSATSPATG